MDKTFDLYKFTFEKKLIIEHLYAKVLTEKKKIYLL